MPTPFEPPKFFLPPAARRKANGVAVHGATTAPAEPALPAGPAPVALAPAVSAAAGPQTAEQVDYALINRLHGTVADRLGDRPAGVSDEEYQRRVRAEAKAVVREYVDDARRAGTVVAEAEELVLLETLLADLVGMGRLQSLLTNPQVENVHIFGHDTVRVELAGGGVVAGPPVAENDDELLLMLQTLAQRAGGGERSLNTSEPWVDLEMPDGSRLAALYEVTPASAGTTTRTVPYAQIRRHRHPHVTLDELAGPNMNMISPAMLNFLKAAMAAKLNIMVAGLGGAGKTTLLRALASEIPTLETFAVLEESRELGLNKTGRHPYVMSLESRQGFGDLRADGRPRGEISAADLIPRMLRMSVTRIVVGEVRSREIVPMLQAMTVSQGSMCTIHARTHNAVFDRIVELALSHGKDMTVDLAKRMAAGALDLIVYVAFDDEMPIGGRKHRYVSHIVELQGGVEGGNPVHTEIFAPGPDGRGVAVHPPERTAQLLRQVGYDPRQLNPEIMAQTGWPYPIQRVTRWGMR